MITQKLIKILLIAISALISALGLHIFVFSMNFAPSGVDGIATMIQSKTGINAGIISFAINIPIFIIGFFTLKLRSIIYSGIYICFASVFLLLLDHIDLFQYTSQSDRIIPAIFAGIILGVRTSIMLKINSSTGGIDIIASIIQKKYPYKNFENIIFLINIVIVSVSFFVYEKNLQAILLSFVFLFVYSRMIGVLMKSTRTAVEYKIVTPNPEEFIEDITLNLKHSATIVKANGMFTNDNRSVIFCVVNTRQITQFNKIIKKHQKTFAYFSDINGVIGNFRWNKNDLPK